MFIEYEGIPSMRSKGINQVLVLIQKWYAVAVFIDPTIGLSKEPSSKNTWELSPNPANDFISLSYSGINQKTAFHLLYITVWVN